jgi:hypothetical protein
MKTEATNKVETLEQRIAAILVATDVTSTAVAGLIERCRSQQSDNRKRDIAEPLPLEPSSVAA